MEEKNVLTENTIEYVDSVKEEKAVDYHDSEQVKRRWDSPDFVQEVENELNRLKKRRNHGGTFRRIFFGLVTVSALAILVAVLFLPVLQIYGNSMTTTLYEGNIVVSIKGADFQQGDVISFYYNNNILVKRVIGFEGDWIDIDEEGNVSVNGVALDEPYVMDKALGDCDIQLPYQVTDGDIFVLGDHRSTSKDSRNTSVGCIPKEKIVGKIVYRLWPLTQFGAIR